MEKTDSYVRNCFIQPREGEEWPLFVEHADGTVTARLDGYRIVPIEKTSEVQAVDG